MQTSRSIAVFDLTVRCPLRCAHCYMDRSQRHNLDLPDRMFLERLASLRDKYGLRSAFWVGGEPLLRQKLLWSAMALFERNAVATSGTVSIPPELHLHAGILVSIDGPAHLHDELRGSGSFARTYKQTRVLPRHSFAISTTLCTRNLTAIDSLAALREQVGASSILIGFYVGLPGDPLRVDGDERSRAIDRLQELIPRHPGLVLNTMESLEVFRPGNQRLPQTCIYFHSATAFDHRLREKRPCTFGSQADCGLCGCPVVALQASRAQGDQASAHTLRQLFPRFGSLPPVNMSP
jgi:MoaA/NifB/PqqE/SkfB family radical SAM enzyme